MAAAKPPKALLVSQWLEQLKSAFPNTPELPRLDFVESVIFAILRENRSTSEALATLTRFKTDYENDFNELRVSSTREIAGKIGSFPDAESRARAIRKFLHDIFDKNYKFQIDGLNKKPFKEIRDELKDYQALGQDHHLAIVQVQCLGGHAFPVDARLLEAARRLGLVDKSTDAATLRGLLEKNIPKAQILHAISLAERFVNEICTHDSPRCKDCPFQKICPYHLELTQPAKPPATEKTKPKTPAASAKQAPPPAPAPAANRAGKAAAAAATATTKPAPAKPAPAKEAPKKPAPPLPDTARAASKPASPPARAAKPAAKSAAKPVPAAPAGKKPAETAPVAVTTPKTKTPAASKAVAPSKESTPPKQPAKPAPKAPAKAIAPAAKAKPAKPAMKKSAEKPAPAPPKKRKS